MNEYFMKEALKEAKKAYQKGETPIGAIIVKNGEIIARAHNKKNLMNNSLMHAELICINHACKQLKNWRLIGCDLYVTMLPCCMCAGAIYESRISNLYYGTNNNLEDYGIIEHIISGIKYNGKTKMIGGILSEECGKLIHNFFNEKRGE